MSQACTLEYILIIHIWIQVYIFSSLRSIHLDGLPSHKLSLRQNIVIMDEILREQSLCVQLHIMELKKGITKQTEAVVHPLEERLPRTETPHTVLIELFYTVP